ncbi:hypothetical protein FRC08_011734 [Ceratobasidium sp. 394]|nr:hypothetical protein FRC08_011734 [Ceratobasidium sp. 394]
MRNLGVIGALAVMGLLSGVLALPTPRVIYPYPIHRSNGVAFAPTIPQNMDDRQGRLEMIFAAFSRAVDVGFVTAVLRPHEHLVSLLRYYNPKERALYRTISSRHPKRTVSIHPETTDGVASTNQRSPRAELGDPGKFPSHDYRRSEDDTVRSSPFQRLCLTS